LQHITTREDGMTMTEPQHDRTRDRATPSLLDQMGGTAGFVYSTIPVIVFVTANAFLSLPLTIGIAVATGLALFGYRLLQREKFSSAVGSLLGVALAAGIVAWTGSARDFFVIGIWASLAGFVVTAGSLLARRPITGVIWNAVHGGTHPWRSTPAVLRAHDLGLHYADFGRGPGRISTRSDPDRSVVSGCRKPRGLRSSRYGVAAQHLSLQ